MIIRVVVVVVRGAVSGVRGVRPGRMHGRGCVLAGVGLDV